jgi:hypothetical protein
MEMGEREAETFVNSNLTCSPSVWKCEPVFTQGTTCLVPLPQALPTLMATHAWIIELTVAARIALSFSTVFEFKVLFQ